MYRDTRNTHLKQSNRFCPLDYNSFNRILHRTLQELRRQSDEVLVGSGSTQREALFDLRWLYGVQDGEVAGSKARGHQLASFRCLLLRTLHTSGCCGSRVPPKLEVVQGPEGPFTGAAPCFSLSVSKFCVNNAQYQHMHSNVLDVGTQCRFVPIQGIVVHF